MFSYACILIGQEYICRYIFMTMYSFNPLSVRRKFYGAVMSLTHYGVPQVEILCGTLVFAQANMNQH
jgi:hypothetical protein